LITQTVLRLWEDSQKYLGNRIVAEIEKNWHEKKTWGYNGPTFSLFNIAF
jgi:hypothetical protein